MGNTSRAAENVVQEMGPDAVVCEVASGRGLAGDDTVRGAHHFVSCLRFAPIIGATARRCRTCTYVR